MTEPSTRAALYSRLSEVLGVEHAGALMSYLPGEEPATRVDVQHLEDRLDRLEDRIGRLEDKIDARMDSFHSALLYQGRTFAMTSVASIVTTAALVTGIVQALL